MQLLLNETLERKKRFIVAWINRNRNIDIPNPRNAEEHYQSYLSKKNRKSVKQSEIITYQAKFRVTVDIKPVITEDPQNSHKLFNATRKWKKYVLIAEKSDDFWMKKI